MARDCSALSNWSFISLPHSPRVLFGICQVLAKCCCGAGEAHRGGQGDVRDNERATRAAPRFRGRSRIGTLQIAHWMSLVDSLMSLR